MSELVDLARRVAERAAGSEQVEAFLTHEREFQVKAYDGSVDTLLSAEPRGAGIRVVRDARAGFAYTSDLTETGLSDALEMARANAVHATEDRAVGIADPWSEEPAEVPGLVHEGQASITPDEKVSFAIELDKATRSADPRVRTVEESGYSDSEVEIAIGTSTGVSGSYRRTDAWCYTLAIATDEGDTEIGFEFDVGRGLADLDPEAVARKAAEKATSVLGAGKIPSARMPVVFEPYTAGQFLGVVAAALTGEAVQKRRSLFAGRIGERVAGELVTLVDDGRIEGASGSGPWDDEGVPTQRTPVIESGILTSFLYDLTSARREGRASTGNARRAGFKSAPGPSPTNLALEPTGESPEEVMGRAGRALLVRDFHGVHSGTNPVSGDFSVGVTGHMLKGGAPEHGVKEVTVAAPMLEILSGVIAVGDDRRWLPFGGSYGGATTLIAEMTVAGS